MVKGGGGGDGPNPVVDGGTGARGREGFAEGGEGPTVAEETSETHLLGVGKDVSFKGMEELDFFGWKWGLLDHDPTVQHFEVSV